MGKNADHQTIGAVMNMKMRAVSARDACTLQRGFIAGRNFIDNIVDLDAHCRAYAMNPDNCLPVLATYDLGNAFPSLVHVFLFAALECANLLAGMLNIDRGFYSLVAGFWRSYKGNVEMLFWIHRGVLQ